MAEGVRINTLWAYRKLARHPLFDHILAGIVRPLGGPVRVGWGMRPSGRAAMARAGRDGGALVLLEDAFVRSLRPGAGAAVYGLLADSRGIHYDVDGASDLLAALESGRPEGWMRQVLSPSENAELLMQRFRELGISKYNWFPGEFCGELAGYEPGVLVVDQTRGDASIRHGGLGDRDFERMLRAALDEVAGQPVYLRGHPDHVMRAKRSCFPRKLLADSRIRFIPPDLSPAQCFGFCHTVMVAGSLMGMEALIHGCRVVTFGWPFYAGWGLTEDRGRPGVVRRTRQLTLAELFEFAYLRYCHYFDPDTCEPCGLGRILDHIGLQKEMFRKNSGRSIMVGFTPWARRIAHSYFRSPAGVLIAASNMEATHGAGAKLLLWGRKQEFPAGLPGRRARVEDGFIRSKGLGAAFNFPYSWVVDETGIYFDASAPSDLENLYNAGFDARELEEARRLIALLREKRLTKYNLAATPVTLDPQLVRGRKVILVPGQVEADASIQFGSPELKTNLALLQRVRELEPDACIVFKAHPDLVAGARHGQVLPPGYAEACDLAVTEGNVLDWLDLCDEVHTMTSTVGFEALIRSKPVTAYGLPFYAGWGLTTDRLVCNRRQRKLTLEELVCGALIRYPRYLNPATGEFTTALKVVEILASDTAAGDRRAWHLRAVSRLKKIWVELAR